MRHVKRYQELFESQTELTPEQIEWLDKCTRGSWTLNPQTGLVDVDGDFNCESQNLTDFKGVRFGVVTGYFDCHRNKLTSLEGAPQSVGGVFTCSHNYLTSLEGAPQSVGGSFYIDGNKLTSLEGAPRTIGGSFSCANNQLTSLEGAPRKMRGDVDRFDSFNYNPVSGSVLKDLYKKMQSGMSWPDAVASYWRYIEYHTDSVLLAPSNPTLSPEDVRGYESLAKFRNKISESVLEALYKKMQSGMSWPDAVARHWRYIRSDEDRILLASSNPTLSPEDVKGYEALGRLRKRVL